MRWYGIVFMCGGGLLLAPLAALAGFLAHDPALRVTLDQSVTIVGLGVVGVLLVVGGLFLTAMSDS